MDNETVEVGTEIEQSTRGRPKGKVKRTPIVDAILSNEIFKGTPNYRSPREIAEQFGVLPATVYHHRTKLGFRKLIDLANNGQRHQEKQVIPGGIRDSQGGLIQSLTRAAVSTDDLVRSLEAEGVISPLDRLKMLSRLIRVGSPMIKIAAIKAIEDLSKTSEGRVGPPAPLTEEDRVARFVRLFLSAGEFTVKAAYNAAFPSKEESQEEISPDPASIQQPGREPAPTLQDLPAGGVA